MSCKICFKSVRSGHNFDKVACGVCSGLVHTTCAGLDANDVKYMTDNNQIWRCRECNLERRKSMSSEAPVTTVSVSSLSDVISLLRKIETDLGNSLEACHAEIKELKERQETRNEKFETCLNTIETLTRRVVSLEKENIQLKERVEDLEQYSRVNMVEIRGLPQQTNENLTSMVCSISGALGCQITEDSIDTCHRIGRAGPEGPAPVVVKFVRRTDKNALLQKRRVKRDFSSRHIGGNTDRPIYINECLSPSRRKLFSLARSAHKEHRFRFLWVRDCKILIRKKEGSPVIELKSVEQLENLIAQSPLPIINADKSTESTSND
ncbi:uncharacterized protein LOC120352444 [Nilaparvata lugens]|uniref:uncharacterized protein LOC120352444 n=1 Tax=Nilaparvata lugens TaxID=108931 RepID=UPI00193E2DC2|nr:uncharacterized protein LOC120352444 [Nilaparvata lugens]